MGAFRPTGDGVEMSLDETEAGVLRQLLVELLELLEDDEDETSSDPLADALGIGTATKPPDDPVLARLFPDGYRDDPEAAGEFRRYTERGLRQLKRANAQRAWATLPGDAGVHALIDVDDAPAWLATLNDMRLAIGTRLGITDDSEREIDALPDDDARAYPFAVYDHLTYLQDTLVQALMTRS